MYIAHKLRLEFVWQSYLNYIVPTYFLKIILREWPDHCSHQLLDKCTCAVGNLALKHIWIFFIKAKTAFEDYEIAKEAARIERFQAEKISSISPKI